jgi:quercetin dioxygenase-like cupin family protein
MHGFWSPGNLTPRKIADGVTAKIIYGDKVMLSLVTMEPDAIVPTHFHPHEQVGMLVSGTMEFAMAQDILPLSGNAMFLVPGNAPHALKAGPHGAVVIQAFSPPREDYMGPAD